MLSEADMTLDDMRDVTKRGLSCGQCDKRLVIAWGGHYGFNTYVLTCGNPEHNTINRHDKEYEKKLKEARMESTALMNMPKEQMLQRIDMAKFPQALTKEDRQVLAQVAISYGFDPLMGEVTIYQGRPFVSIDGRYRKAQETGKLDGVETRPATKQERENWQIPERDYFYRSEVYIKGASHPFVGWGRVYAAEVGDGKGYLPVQKTPQRMAEKRAEAQALRKAFHIPLPSAEDIGVDEYEPTAKVDTRTGEIIEGESKDLPPTKPEPAPAPDSSGIDLTWALESVKTLDWKPGNWIFDTFAIQASSLKEAIKLMSPDQQKQFGFEIEARLKKAGK